jgi:hypothetical protein
LAEGDGIEKSSEAASDPPGASASVAASRSVFLSYASHDADVAKSICEYLERHGISCWMAPRDVRPGAHGIVRSVAFATDGCLKASWVSAAPNALTECQRVRRERPRESKGRTAVAGQVSSGRRAADSPSPGEGRSPNGPARRRILGGRV